MLHKIRDWFNRGRYEGLRKSYDILSDEYHILKEQLTNRTISVCGLLAKQTEEISKLETEHAGLLKQLEANESRHNRRIKELSKQIDHLSVSYQDTLEKLGEARSEIEYLQDILREYLKNDGVDCPSS